MTTNELHEILDDENRKLTASATIKGKDFENI